MFIVYELNSCPRNFETDCTLGGCLFGGVKRTKNADPDKYFIYSDYGTGFDTCGGYFLPDDSIGNNVIIFGVNLSAFLDIYNRKRYLNSY